MHMKSTYTYIHTYMYRSGTVGHIQRQGERQPAGPRHVQSEGEHAMGRRHLRTGVRPGRVQRGRHERLQHGRNVLIHTYIHTYIHITIHNVGNTYIQCMLVLSGY